jgi:hypothetical protein
MIDAGSVSDDRQHPFRVPCAAEKASRLEMQRKVPEPCASSEEPKNQFSELSN